jgi:energy-coupling factor transporter ATP-binding protein EcfA2
MAGGMVYCQPTLRTAEGQSVVEELITAQLALGRRLTGARARALQALERVGASRCEGRWPSELDRAEMVRVSVARALLREPSLLIIDEPTTGVEPVQREKILSLLRSLTQENIAVLMSLDRGSGLFASDRALSLSAGELRGHLSPELAPVVELPLRVSG